MSDRFVVNYSRKYKWFHPFTWRKRNRMVENLLNSDNDFNDHFNEVLHDKMKDLILYGQSPRTEQ